MIFPCFSMDESNCLQWCKDVELLVTVARGLLEKRRLRDVEGLINGLRQFVINSVSEFSGLTQVR